MYDDETKYCKVKITQANLHVRNMSLTENVYTANATTLTKMPLIYRYTKIIPKFFFLSQLKVVAGIKKIILTENLFVGLF